MNTIDASRVIKAFKLEGKSFAVLDFESSRIDMHMANTDQTRLGVGLPIQIGALQYDEEGKLTEISKYINQGDYNPENDMIETKDKFFSITDLTGVTRANLQDEEFADQRITECQLVQYGFADSLMIGYNISYDSRVMKEVYSRCKLPFTSIQIVDVMAIYIDLYSSVPGYIKYGYNRALQKPYYSGYKLEDCAHKLRVVEKGIEQDHDALSDVQWTLAVLDKIIQDFPDLDYTKYINKIYYNPCYEIPAWQRLIKEGVSYYPFGTKEKQAKIFNQFTLYNYKNFNESEW